MPNWCYNSIDIRGKKSEVIRFLGDLIGKPQVIYSSLLNLSAESDYEMLGELEALREEEPERVTYSKILPQPDSVLLGREPWYEWRCNNWGVKWDIGELSTCTIEDAINDPICNSEDDFCVSFGYETPWSPPEAFFCYASTKYDVNITMLSEEPGVMLYQKILIANGNRIYEIDTENELIFHYMSDYSIEDALNYYLEVFYQNIASDDYEDYDYVIDNIHEFCDYLVDNGTTTKEMFNNTLKQQVRNLENDEKISNLILSRLLAELQEKVAVSN